MKERISCFDIDGTLSRGMLFVPLVKSEYEAGYLDDSSFSNINELLVAYKTGQLAYEDAVEQLLQAHAHGLRGQTHHDLKTHAKEFLAVHGEELFYAFGRSAIRLLMADHEAYVVTAEPQYLAQAVADMYAMSGSISSVYGEQAGVFSGAITRSLAYRSEKSAALRHYAIECAFGDSEGDIAMLSDARHAYCINPSADLVKMAQHKGWKQFDGNDKKGIIQSLNEVLQ